jgi:hypothetical protein
MHTFSFFNSISENNFMSVSDLLLQPSLMFAVDQEWSTWTVRLRRYLQTYDLAVKPRHGQTPQFICPGDEENWFLNV